jgi:phage replication O-like protein O
MPKGDRYKLKADPDDGVTRISNLLLEALAMARLSGMEKGAILYLWRRTYGWYDPEHPKKRIVERHIGLSEWCKWLNCNKTCASRVLTVLVKHGIITQESIGQGKGYIYAMNTYVEQWNGNCINKEHLLKCITVNQMDNSTPNGMLTVNQMDNTTVNQMDNTTVNQMDNTIMPAKESIKRNILKETTTRKEKPVVVVGIDEIISMFSDNITKVNPIIITKLTALADKYGVESLKEAVIIAATKKKSLDYIEGILKNKTMDKDFENRT